METLNLSTKRGDTWNGLVITMALNNAPLDLTDAQIRCQLKKNSCDDTSVLELSTGSGITILEPLSGKFQIDPVIIDILPRDYSYDVQMTLADAKVITPFGGLFTIISDVTR